ncbi:hypothetical protein LOZ61_003899 [Ophidiomyces ophidiicola]|uniref:Uncharacterized protein n=1 Tax=Ophidiomyces ophidiicola TaxID=1387563 RepID=A0ACB8UY17_9EURO|nr:uncharacterized protein LOZ57_001291 [Ophidiomyces ophidiicola]KAI1911376.1 hypothetical protein LOZ61_003899 [Ophidiomyces ophidiicola]KAI1918476.1 hypothetical protein LOZ64_002705 [Ophidiomyces ophidiicola]KAI1926835.1 hypothetical protein LOZ60_003324 [Ophidiomyces ophidiicola]KAI1951878.1 hypothetical protein LOZ57_001291 [Ophidiomyces ophidiicola]KAI1958752.1 hypothetical protein LOZ59_003314 [Ophidiomyces ophidiicola]
MPHCVSSASADASVAAESLASPPPDAPLPYWLVNVPREEWPSECPEFLRDLPEKSIRVLATPDSEYVRLDWPAVRHFVETNQINRFLRLPSDLRRYLEYMAQIKAQYGSVLDFIIQERLRWDSLEPTCPTPFAYPGDYKVLYNDWPYGIDADIVHLVVWTKFELQDDPQTDDLTVQAQREIDEFVDGVFRSRVPGEQVVWFKNWRSLKSIHSVEHFHVMLKAPDMGFVHEITGGDVPLAEKLRGVARGCAA